MSQESHNRRPVPITGSVGTGECGRRYPGPAAQLSRFRETILALPEKTRETVPSAPALPMSLPGCPLTCLLWSAAHRHFTVQIRGGSVICHAAVDNDGDCGILALMALLECEAAAAAAHLAVRPFRRSAGSTATEHYMQQVHRFTTLTPQVSVLSAL